MDEKTYDLLKMILPAIIVLVGTVITNKINIKSNAKRFQDEKKKIKLENEISQYNKNKDEFLVNQKELFKLIQHIKSGFSITQNYIMQESNFSWGHFNAHYAGLIELSLQAQLIVHMYFLDLKEKIDEICSLIDVGWGQQKNLFLQYDVDQQYAHNEFTKYSLIIKEKCEDIMRDVEDLSFEDYIKR